MAPRCEVCTEILNRSNHKQVECPYCPYVACTSCHERYLLETTEDAHCMSCHKGWPRDVLVVNFTSKFVTKTYKERRENLLFERERSLMPATQPYVEIEKTIRKLAQKQDQLYKHIQHYHTQLDATRRTPITVFMVERKIDNEFDAIMARYEKEADILKRISPLEIDINTARLQQNRLAERMNGANGLLLEKRAFVRSCPYENCKGFLSTAWKCGLCENWTCPTCHEVKGPDKDGEHVCDANNVATAELLARDSRNCPKCASMIFKIDGCDQMWCTQCHTAFSWRTGRIETHTVHNPHYYEYQRAHGILPRQPGDVPCGGFPDWHTISRFIGLGPHLYGARNDPRVNSDNPMRRDIISAYRSHPHAIYTLIPRYTEVERATENRDLRIKFMLEDITDDEFKKKIQQREKSNQRKRAIRQVLDMYTTIITDIFQTFQQTRDIVVLHESLCGLRDHYNATLDRVKVTYKCMVPSLLESFNFRI